MQSVWFDSLHRIACLDRKNSYHYHLSWTFSFIIIASIASSFTSNVVKVKYGKQPGRFSVSQIFVPQIRLIKDSLVCQIIFCRHIDIVYIISCQLMNNQPWPDWVTDSVFASLVRLVHINFKYTNFYDQQIYLQAGKQSHSRELFHHVILLKS